MPDKPYKSSRTHTDLYVLAVIGEFCRFITACRDTAWYTLSVDRGILLATLRRTRGFSQESLAQAAGVSRNPIAVVEANPTASIRRSTLELICAALEKARPFTDEEREDFLRAFGLVGASRAAQRAMAAVPALTPSARQSPANSINAMAAASQAAHDETYARFERLRHRYGSLMLSKVLDAIEILLPMAAIASKEDPTVRVVSPPVQRDGYTEQVITEYEQPKRQPPVKSAREKRA